MNKREYLLLLGTIWLAPHASYFVGCVVAGILFIWAFTVGKCGEP